MHMCMKNRSKINELCTGYFGLNITKRLISNAEIATALRPFYFVVHPDLFGRYPQQRSINEESLKHLSAHLEAMQNYRTLTSSPRVLSFYIRNSDAAEKDRDKFKLVNIRIQRTPDVKMTVKKILESCSLSTEYVDKIKSAPQNVSSKPFDYYANSSNNSSPYYNSGGGNGHTNSNTSSTYYDETSSAFESEQEIKEKMYRAKMEKTLKGWLSANLDKAYSRSDALDGLRKDVKNLEKSIIETLQLKDIQSDCGWNVEHYRGCLKSLERLANNHLNDMAHLKDRTLVFAPCSGVSLEGHVMLFTGDVQRNWLEFIRNIPKQDDYLKRIPAYELALSQVLRDIRIARRKFMPKAQVVNYAAQLCKVTTAMLDYLTYHSYPKSWPNSLKDYKIVIESEAGPLMLSPTGQFIAPSSCPGSILVDFLTTHLDEATKLIAEYKKNKYIERELHDRCTNEMNLKSLTKDDSIDPSKMIECLNKLLTSQLNLRNTILHITHYYSVLSDGTVCIPWDWILE